MKNFVAVSLLFALAACGQMTKEQYAAMDAYQAWMSPGARGAMSMNDMVAMGYVGKVRSLDEPAYPSYNDTVAQQRQLSQQAAR